MVVYVVGPCGSGKTTLARRLGVMDVDMYVKANYPSLWERKPWRYFIDSSLGNREDAALWQEVQVKAMRSLSLTQDVVIGHPRAWLSSAIHLPIGHLVVLEPHRLRALEQRKDDPDLVQITQANWRVWPQEREELLLAAESWHFPVVQPSPRMGEQQQQRLVIGLKDACLDMGDRWLQW